MDTPFPDDVIIKCLESIEQAIAKTGISPNKKMESVEDARAFVNELEKQAKSRGVWDELRALIVVQSFVEGVGEGPVVGLEGVDERH